MQDPMADGLHLRFMDLVDVPVTSDAYRKPVRFGVGSFFLLSFSFYFWGQSRFISSLRGVNSSLDLADIPNKSIHLRERGKSGAEPFYKKSRKNPTHLASLKTEHARPDGGWSRLCFIGCREPSACRVPVRFGLGSFEVQRFFFWP
jgi:hypothetical protein